MSFDSTRALKLLIAGALAILAMAMPGPAFAAGADPSISILRESPGRVEARVAGGGAVVLDAKSQDLSFHTAGSGQPLDLHVVSLYEPESGLFWWTYRWLGRRQPEDRIDHFRRRQFILVTEREILAVETAKPPPSLRILRSTSRVDSRQQGEARMRGELVRHFDAVRGAEHPWLMSIELWDRLEADFYYQPGHTRPSLELEVTAVEPIDAGWSIELAGRSDRRARLVLDHQLGLLSAEESK